MASSSGAPTSSPPHLQQQPPPPQPPQPFDMTQFFKPSTTTTPPPPPQNPNPNLLPPAASYPPPSGPYSYPPQTAPFQHNQFQYPHPIPYPPHQDHHLLQQQRSLSFPIPPLQPPSNYNIATATSNPNSGARIMALLGAPPSEIASPPPPPQPEALPMGIPPSPVRMPSNKLPKGRHLIGESVVYDIDVRLPGEFQPQLEVTPITKYGSDPQLVLGRQIAVNKSYICYGLKQGNIRVLNIHTALRSLFRAHTQRVTDMAFFAEDVHLLASVSVEGRLFVWKISEGPDEEGTPQITEEDYEYKKEVARLSTLALVLLAMSSKPTLEARFSSSCLPSQFDSDGLGTRFGELGAARGTTWGRLIWSPSAVVE